MRGREDAEPLENVPMAWDWFFKWVLRVSIGIIATVMVLGISWLLS